MIKIDKLCKQYRNGAGSFDALKNASFHIKKGEFAAVTGASGSGKTTLMNIIGCLDKANSGTYFLDGLDIFSAGGRTLTAIRNEKIAFIFQSFNLLQGLSALENTALPLIYRGVSRKEAYMRAEKALSDVGLAMRADSRPSQLSGGQQQRVAAARAIAADTPVILADEPCGSLDSRSGSRVMELLHEQHRKGKTVVLITHDLNAAASADRVITVADGEVFG